MRFVKDFETHYRPGGVQSYTPVLIIPVGALTSHISPQRCP